MRVRPAHSLKVLQLLPVAYLTLNLKSFSCHGRSQQQDLTSVGRCFLSVEGIDTAIIYKQLAVCFLDKAHVTEMKLNQIFSQSIGICLFYEEDLRRQAPAGKTFVVSVSFLFRKLAQRSYRSGRCSKQLLFHQLFEYVHRKKLGMATDSKKVHLDGATRWMTLPAQHKIAHNHGRPQKFFQGGKRRHFTYLFRVADDAMLMDVHKTLYPF